MRLIVHVEDLFGGSGASAIIGQLPVLSDFPTSTSATSIVALPDNVPYDLVNPSVSVVESAVPEPSAYVMWSMVGLIFGGANWLHRFRCVLVKAGP
jgi:hypothetical protein